MKEKDLIDRWLLLECLFPFGHKDPVDVYKVITGQPAIKTDVETEIVPSHPVFWSSEWKCLNCNELIYLPKKSDVCDYKYCPYCKAKNKLAGITMEDLHSE